MSLPRYSPPSAPTPAATLPLAVAPSRVRVAQPSEILKAVRACATRGWRGTENRGERKLRGSGLRVSPRADACRLYPLACAFCEREKLIYARALHTIHIQTYIHRRVIYIRARGRAHGIRVYTCVGFVTYRQYFYCLGVSGPSSLRPPSRAAVESGKSIRDARNCNRSLSSRIRDNRGFFHRAVTSLSDTLSSAREEKLSSADSR